MKKVWLGALVVALGIALASPAMAIDWSASGFIGTLAITGRNIPPAYAVVALPPPASPAAVIVANDALNDEFSYLRMRARLRLVARASEDLYGVMYFEMNARTYGNRRGAWGVPAGPNTTGTWWGWETSGATRPNDVEVKELYVDFKIPGITIPVWMRIGRQAYAIRPFWFMYQEGAGISGRVKIDPVTIYVGYGKAYEGWEHLADDWDLWAWHISAPISTFKVGLFGAYEDFRQVAVSNIPVPLVPVPIQWWNQAIWLTPNGDLGDLHMWWVGAYVDGKIGPVKVSFDFVYDGGKFDSDDTTVAPDVKFSGWMIRPVVSYTWNNFTFGLGGFYASGNDWDDMSTDPTSIEANAYVTPYGSMAFALSSDLLVLQGGWNNKMKLNDQFSPIGGIASLGGYWFVRPFIDWQALDWLKLRFQFAYIGDTSDDMDTFTVQLDSLGNVEDHDDIGWEFDLGAVINVYKNLTLNLGFGYLVAGDALNELWLTTDSSGRAVNDNVSVDDPWTVFAELVYTF